MPCSGPRYLPAADFGVGGLGLGQRALFGERDDEVQLRIVALEAGEVHLRQRQRSDLARASSRLANSLIVAKARSSMRLGACTEASGFQPSGRLIRGTLQYHLSRLPRAAADETRTPAERSWAD